MNPFRIVPTDSFDGPCECCGDLNRVVSGRVCDDAEDKAVFLVSWTLGRVDRGAVFAIVLGDLAPGSPKRGRFGASIAYELAPDGPRFAITEPEVPMIQSLEADCLMPSRRELVMTSREHAMVAAADFVLGFDDRIAELRGRWQLHAEPVS